MIGSVLAFAAVAAVVTVTPGIDTALVLRTALASGTGAGVLVAAGTGAGLLVWGLATALGVSLLVTASEVGYDILRAAGAVWLVLLGARAIAAARLPHGEIEEPPTADPLQRGPAPLRCVRTGLVSNLLNPKVGVFYVTALPQFVPAGASVLAVTMVLAAVHVVEGLLWLGLVAWGAGRARDLLSRDAVRRGMERLTGVVLIAFGVRLALQRR